MLEVVAAVAVVGVSMVACMSMFGSGVKNYKSLEERVIAANLLQRKVEEIKAKDYSTNFTANGAIYAGYSMYLFYISESVFDPLGEGLSLKRIDVTLRWYSFLGAQAEKKVCFLKARR